jgi:hypothetical protein
MPFVCIPYTREYESQWDNFITADAANGTFLHSRNFLNYHPKNRFADRSLLICKDNHIAAVIPACTIVENGEKIFVSHAGSTFGGVVIHRKYLRAANILEIINGMEKELKTDDHRKILMKITPDIFAEENSDLLQYALANCDYDTFGELNTYIDFDTYKPNVKDNITHGQKENLKIAQKNGLTFKPLDTAENIARIHAILSKNLSKYNAKPVHSIEELLDFKQNRLKNIAGFYGVFLKTQMIAGAMTFRFAKTVHTQYLAADPDHAPCRPASFLYYKLIETARENGFSKLSWGISTENNGRFLNSNLLAFKESFGSKHSLNRGFYKRLS